MKHFFRDETLFSHFFYLYLQLILGIFFMKKHVFWCISVLMILSIVSCNEDNSLKKIEQIKLIGDTNPNKALSMLDSIEIEIRGEGEYIRNKADLLRIRLNDKAYKMPTSDIMIRKLVTYFEENGSIADKQEVYHYAGSIYRDLQDTPRALEHFFKAMDYANENPKECDSVMLGKTYSNINYLQFKVQNFNEALKAAINELEICNKTNSDPTIPFSHVAAAYHALGKNVESEAAFDSTLAHIIQEEITDSLNQEILVILLENYVELNKLEKAKECIKQIKGNPLEGEPSFSCIAYGEYYRALGMRDSAAMYFSKLLDGGSDIYYKYDAAKLLFGLFNKAGDHEKARQYAAAYMELSDSLDFGKRQEMAASVNNAYQYHLDQKKEQDLKDEKERYKNTTIIAILAAALLASVGYILNFKRKIRHQKEMAALSSELQRVTDNGKHLRKEIKRKEKELAASKDSLKKSSSELDDVKQKLQLVNQELAENTDALKKTEQQLVEKKEQNKTFIKLLHQSEFEVKAEEIIRAVREASKGKKEMTLAEWKQLYQAVDELYPTFHETILKQPERVSDKEIQFLYLLRIGLSKHQIMNMTDLARVTIWRWEKRFEWVFNDAELDSSNSSMIGEAETNQESQN